MSSTTRLPLRAPCQAALTFTPIWSMPNHERPLPHQTISPHSIPSLAPAPVTLTYPSFSCPWSFCCNLCVTFEALTWTSRGWVASGTRPLWLQNKVLYFPASVSGICFPLLSVFLLEGASQTRMYVHPIMPLGGCWVGWKQGPWSLGPGSMYWPWPNAIPSAYPLPFCGLTLLASPASWCAFLCSLCSLHFNNWPFSLILKCSLLISTSAPMHLCSLCLEY